jgi:hypothetical protein
MGDRAKSPSYSLLESFTLVTEGPMTREDTSQLKSNDQRTFRFNFICLLQARCSG